MSYASPISVQEQTALLTKLEEQLQAQQEELSSRRSTPRYPLNARVRLLAEAEDGSLRQTAEAWALDFSHHGLGLLTERPFQFNDKLLVDFGPAFDVRFHARFTVVYGMNLVGSIQRIGGRFVV